MSDVYGIDLGTTFTKCALCVGGDEVRVFKLDVDPHGADKAVLGRLPGLRSAVTVALRGGRRIAVVGNRAISARERFRRENIPHFAFEESKLWIGTDFSGSCVADAPPWSFSDHGWDYLPEDAGALVLRALSREVERVGSRPVRRAVITHPAQFTSTQQEATRHAAAIAGIEVVDLLSEPEAAAIAYSRDLKDDGLYLIYDAGGGTLDLVLLEIKGRQIRSIGKDGAKIGGRDVDRAILNMLIAEYANYTSGVFRAEMLGVVGEQLWLADAEKIKWRLNEQANAAERLTFRLKVDSSYAREAGLLDEDLPESFEVKYCRADVEEVTANLLDASRDLVGRVMHDAGVKADRLKGIIAVGGSTKLRAVEALLVELAGGCVLRSRDPDTVVAMGAAIYGASIPDRDSGRPAPSDILQRTPYRSTLYQSLSIKITAPDGASRLSQLVKRGTPTPLDRPLEKRFTTDTPGQDHIQIQLYEGESSDPDDCENNFIGECRIDGFKPSDELQPVVVGIQIEGNGTKRISVKVGGATIEKQIDFDPAKVLTRDRIQERTRFVESLSIVDD